MNAGNWIRVRNWVFTAFKEPNIETGDAVSYFIYKPETCPSTQRLHYQGYIEFNKKMTISGIKKLFNDNSIHLEPRRGTQEQAIKYVLKEETKAGEPISWGEPKKAGKRSDIEDILHDVNEGDTMKEILSNHGGNALRMIHCIEKAMKVKHGLYPLDDYIELHRKRPSQWDRLDEKIDDDLYKLLYK